MTIKQSLAVSFDKINVFEKDSFKGAMSRNFRQCHDTSDAHRIN